MSSNRSALQTLVNIASDNSSMERYLLQPTKSVILSILAGKDKTSVGTSHEWTLNGEPMLKATETVHMGILRSKTTEDSAVQENVSNARRTLYGLMSSGLHGENGLDPDTSIHLMQTYVMPVLVYELEVVLPKQKHLDTLERLNGKLLKLILSQPVNVADPAVYISK